MFGILPCFWSQPVPRRFKPIDHHFLQPVTVRIVRPVPSQSVPKPVVNTIPACELLKPGEEIDTTEIDKMLDEIFNPTPEAKTKQIFQMIQTINEHLEKNIKVLQYAPAVDGDNVSREDLRKLLQMFLNYSKSVENYLKSINQVQTL